MSDIPVRKRNRLKNYDYSQNGVYFITICVKDRMELLCEISVEDSALGVPSVHFTPYGNIVREHVENIPNAHPNIFLDQYVIMPNHIHLLLRIATQCHGGTPRAVSPTTTIVSKTMNALKGLTSKKAGFPLWQRSYYDHIIRDDNDYHRIAEYIEQNPQRWQEDCFYPIRTVSPEDGDRNKMLAWRKLKSELDEGRRSGETHGWTPADDVRAHFEARYRG
jgi:REP element-mobilizing transposase RayT